MMRGCDHGYAKDLDLRDPEEFAEEAAENGEDGVQTQDNGGQPMVAGEKRETVVTDGEKASMHQF